ncbi:MAG: glycosyltransferase [Cryomorphaceae bacterium]|nr:MAG: glycosyltransferase [Cryomorphaceae bacterium]
MRVLYLSYDGLTDALGQSQILPYLRGLANRGHHIDIISFEKPERYTAQGKEVMADCQKHGIGYYPITYTKNPPVLSTLFDIRRMKKKAQSLHRENPYQWVHCRSYISAIVGQWMQSKFGVKFLFDMRGFYADERVDGNIWPQSNPIYRSVYSYFKRKERDFLTRADHVISLTHKAKTIIESWNVVSSPDKISVIPCCVDSNHFQQSTTGRQKVRNALGIDNDTLLIGYVGSTGTWYLLKEMLLFFKEVTKLHPTAKLYFITLDNPSPILEKARQVGLRNDQLHIAPAERSDLPAHLSALDLSMFFIKPVFSKAASSPTKHGELMSVGIPVICNAGVGDTDEIVQSYGAGYCLYDFSPPSMKEAAKAVSRLLKSDVSPIIEGAKTYFSLEKGVDQLHHIYESANKPTSPTPL